MVSFLIQRWSFMAEKTKKILLGIIVLAHNPVHRMVIVVHHADHGRSMMLNQLEKVTPPHVVIKAVAHLVHLHIKVDRLPVHRQAIDKNDVHIKDQIRVVNLLDHPRKTNQAHIKVDQRRLQHHDIAKNVVLMKEPILAQHRPEKANQVLIKVNPLEVKIGVIAKIENHPKMVENQVVTKANLPVMKEEEVPLKNVILNLFLLKILSNLNTI
jgi:hypothetical protein